MDVVLDVSRMAVDENGVRGFVWPIARGEILAARDALLPPLVAAAREPAAAGNDVDAELLSLVLVEFAFETIGLYQAHALCRRLGNLGHSITPPPGGRLLTALAQGSFPPPSPLLGLLERGVPAARRPRLSSVHQMWTHLQWNGPSLTSLRPFDRDRDIVATQRLPLIRHHARAQADFVRFVHPREWLRPLNADSMCGRLVTPSAGGVRGALAAVRVGFAAGNEEAPDYLMDYLRDWLVRAMTLAGSHLETVIQQPERVPRRLWSGSGSGVWNRILRHATRRLGGTVTGHDHGNGEGLFESAGSSVSEFESCDEFVTFTPLRARALGQRVRADMMVQRTVPSVVSIPSRTEGASPFLGTNHARMAPRLTRRSSGTRTVMYPTIFYPGESVYPFWPLLPDPVAVDWHVRVISRLRTWGYEVVLKPHPGHVETARAVSSELGVTVLADPFEQVLGSCDVLLFDYPRTTTFGVALATNKPVVFVDWGQEVFTSDARSKLERRCCIVRAWFDEENRVRTDWNELRTAIEESPRLTDRAFADSYLMYEYGGTRRPG